MAEDAEWWFDLCIVRRNEKNEEDCGLQRMQNGSSPCGL